MRQLVVEPGLVTFATGQQTSRLNFNSKLMYYSMEVMQLRHMSHEILNDVLRFATTPFWVATDRPSSLVESRYVQTSS